MIITEQNNSVIVKIQSGLISANMEQFNMDVFSSVSKDKEFDELVLDLSETDCIDSFGVSFVIGLYKTCLNEGKHFKVTGSSEDIIQLFKLMKLDDFFELD